MSFRRSKTTIRPKCKVAVNSKAAKQSGGPNLRSHVSTTSPKKQTNQSLKSPKNNLINEGLIAENEQTIQNVQTKEISEMNEKENIAINVEPSKELQNELEIVEKPIDAEARMEVTPIITISMEVEASTSAIIVTLENNSQNLQLQLQDTPMEMSFEHQTRRRAQKRPLIDSSDERIARLKEDRQKKERIRHLKMIMKNRIVPERAKMTMGDLICWNPEHKPSMVHPEEPQVIGNVADDEDTNSSTAPDQNSLGPQLSLDANGEIVLDESSVIVQRSNNSESLFGTSKNRDSNLHNGKKKNSRINWSDEETLKFYRILATVGTDFSMMNEFFPNLTRTQLKNKYKLENKKNPELIEKARTNQYFNLKDLEEENEVEESIEATF